MIKKVRVYRLLEYYGTEEWIKRTLEGNGVKGIHYVGKDGWIREVVTSGDRLEIASTPSKLIDLEPEKEKP